MNPSAIYIYINNNSKVGAKASSRSHAPFSLTYYAFIILRNLSSARHWTIYHFHRYDSILLRSCNSLRHWRTLLYYVLILRFDIINLISVMKRAVGKSNWQIILILLTIFYTYNKYTHTHTHMFLFMYYRILIMFPRKMITIVVCLICNALL